MEAEGRNDSETRRNENDSDAIHYLPEAFHQCDAKHLTTLIADMLGRLVAHNDQIPLTTNNLTRFHSRVPPGISISDYIRRISKYAGVDKLCLLVLLVYIDRVCERDGTFTISSLTAHRFIITSITCACKVKIEPRCNNQQLIIHWQSEGILRLLLNKYNVCQSRRHFHQGIEHS